MVMRQDSKNTGVSMYVHAWKRVHKSLPPGTSHENKPETLMVGYQY